MISSTPLLWSFFSLLSPEREKKEGDGWLLLFMFGWVYCSGWFVMGSLTLSKSGGVTRKEKKKDSPRKAEFIMEANSVLVCSRRSSYSLPILLFLLLFLLFVFLLALQYITTLFLVKVSQRLFSMPHSWWGQPSISFALFKEVESSFLVHGSRISLRRSSSMAPSSITTNTGSLVSFRTANGNTTAIPTT